MGSVFAAGSGIAGPSCTPASSTNTT